MRRNHCPRAKGSAGPSWPPETLETAPWDVEEMNAAPDPAPPLAPAMPRGIEFVAGLFHIAAGVLAWGVLWTFGWASEGGDRWPFLAPLLMLACSATFAVTGWGVRRRRPWARWVALGLAGLAAIAMFVQVVIAIGYVLAS